MENDVPRNVSLAEMIFSDLQALAVRNQNHLASPGPTSPSARHDAQSTLFAFRLLAEQMLPPAFEILKRGLAPAADVPEQADEVMRKRTFIAEILKVGSTLPTDLAAEIGRGLSALNQGEVNPLFERAATGQHGNAAKLLDLKMKAVWHVCFLRGQGRTKAEARDIVSRDIPFGVDALTTWEKDQRAKEKRSNSAGSLLRAAEIAGRLQAEFVRSGSMPPTDDRTALVLRDLLTGKLDLPALAEAFRYVSREGIDVAAKRRRMRRSAKPSPT
jgi:hypothetical protein